MRHRLRFRFPLLIFTLLLLGACASPLPKPVDSPWFRTAAGGFMMDLADDRLTVRDLYYHLVLEPVKPLTHPLYLHTRFPDPASPGREILVDQRVAAGATQVVIRSPRLKRIERGATYRVRVEIFADAGHNRQLGVHEQAVYAGADVDDKVHL